MRSVCIFCGSSKGTDGAYLEAARQTGICMVQRGHRLVFGGSCVGLMGAIADTILEHGGEAIGVMPQFLVEKERAHPALTELRVVNSMHERKALMAELSDGFIALPGGFGTYEEFCEVLTWGQLGFHRKPCGLLNVKGFYDPLLALFDQAVNKGFVRTEDRKILIAAEAPQRLLNLMEDYDPPRLPQWAAPDKAE